MSVKEVNEKYRCNICGNEVIVTKVGNGTLACCGEEMELVEESSKKIKEALLEEGIEVEDEEEEEDYKEDLEGEGKEEEEI